MQLIPSKPPAQAIKAMHYEKPSPIQMAAIPLGMKFRDVIGVAETVSLFLNPLFCLFPSFF